jgi:hypothetical protein
MHSVLSLLQFPVPVYQSLSDSMEVFVHVFRSHFLQPVSDLPKTDIPCPNGSENGKVNVLFISNESVLIPNQSGDMLQVGTEHKGLEVISMKVLHFASLP